MAQVKISALTAADPLTGVEEAPFVQGGATKKATTEQIREYVASQPNVFSVTQRIEDAAPALQFSENDTTDQNWEFIGVAGALRLDELNDAFSTTGTHHTFTHGGGTQFGSPTGGDQGAGTINAEAVYDDGTLLTDYVFDAEIDGAVDADAYDAATPDREYRDDGGKVLKTETRKHAPARKFSSELDELDPFSFEQKWRATRKLPAVARLESEKPSIGELSQALLETCEVQAVHIAKLEARIAALEASK